MGIDAHPASLRYAGTSRDDATVRFAGAGGRLPGLVKNDSAVHDSVGEPFRRGRMGGSGAFRADGDKWARRGGRALPLARSGRTARPLTFDFCKSAGWIGSRSERGLVKRGASYGLVFPFLVLTN